MENIVKVVFVNKNGCKSVTHCKMKDLLISKLFANIIEDYKDQSITNYTFDVIDPPATRLIIGDVKNSFSSKMIPLERIYKCANFLEYDLSHLLISLKNDENTNRKKYFDIIAIETSPKVIAYKNNNMAKWIGVKDGKEINYDPEIKLNSSQGNVKIQSIVHNGIFVPCSSNKKNSTTIKLSELCGHKDFLFTKYQTVDNYDLTYDLVYDDIYFQKKFTNTCGYTEQYFEIMKNACAQCFPKNTKEQNYWLGRIIKHNNNSSCEEYELISHIGEYYGFEFPNPIIFYVGLKTISIKSFDESFSKVFQLPSEITSLEFNNKSTCNFGTLRDSIKILAYCEIKQMIIVSYKNKIYVMKIVEENFELVFTVKSSPDYEQVTTEDLNNPKKYKKVYSKLNDDSDDENDENDYSKWKSHSYIKIDENGNEIIDEKEMFNISNATFSESGNHLILQYQNKVVFVDTHFWEITSTVYLTDTSTKNETENKLIKDETENKFKGVKSAKDKDETENTSIKDETENKFKGVESKDKDVESVKDKDVETKVVQAIIVDDVLSNEWGAHNTTPIKNDIDFDYDKFYKIIDDVKISNDNILKQKKEAKGKENIINEFIKGEYVVKITELEINDFGAYNCHIYKNNQLIKKLKNLFDSKPYCCFMDNMDVLVTVNGDYLDCDECDLICIDLNTGKILLNLYSNYNIGMNIRVRDGKLYSICGNNCYRGIYLSVHKLSDYLNNPEIISENNIETLAQKLTPNGTFDAEISYYSIISEDRFDEIIDKYSV